MYKTHAAFAVIIAILLLSSCKDPHDYVIPPDINQWKADEGLAKSVEKLSDQEKSAVAAWMIRHGMSQAFGAPILPTGTTIRSAIEQQAKFEKEKAEKNAEEARILEEQEKLRKKAEEDRQHAVSEMRNALTVAMTKFEFMPSNFESRRYSDGFNVEFVFQNNTEKDIIGVKGATVFSDMFGDKIKAVKMSMDEKIPAKGKTVWKGSMEYNQFMDDDKALRSKTIDKLKVIWEPNTYLFSDGTKMTIEM